MFARILGLFGSVPHALLIRAAVVVLVFAIGYAAGNSHATQRALDREIQASADRQRENNQKLFEWGKQLEAKLKAATEQQRVADAAAYDILQARKAESDRALARTRAQLKTLETAQQNKLAEVRDVLASEVPSDPGCVLDSSVRVALNAAIASINNHPVIGSAEAEGPGVLDGPDSPNSILTCGELASSVTDILEHDAMLTAWVLSFQAWEVEISR